MYDRWQSLRFSPYRLRAVELLELRPGERVIELPLYVTTFEGLDRPWRHLEGLASDVRVEQGVPPVFFYATGRVVAGSPADVVSESASGGTEAGR